MRNWTLLVLVVVFLLCFLVGSPEDSHASGPVEFDQTEWQARFVDAWQSRDLTRIEGLYSEIYNNAGDSKLDAVLLASKLLQRNSEIICRYRILSSRQFLGTNLASVRYILEMKGREATTGGYHILTQTMGYLSLIFENGQWRIYASQFFCDPRIPNFNYDREQGNWPSFDRQVRLLSYDPATPAPSDDRWTTTLSQPISMPIRGGDTHALFNKTAWEQQIMEGWNNRNASIILSTFSRIYNEVGVSREEAIRPVSGFFERFEKLHCRYRVLAFRQFRGTNLASVKAVMEMSGVPTGQKNSIMLIQTMGYASLIYEDGQWRMYASQLFYFPQVPHFNFDEEKGQWPPWGTVVDMKPY